MFEYDLTTLFEKARDLQFGEFHIDFDMQTGLIAIVAIHSTKLGPALGGCRLASYDSPEAAILDVMRLSRGMSYKSAIAGLDLGGGKAVIMKPHHIKDRDALFQSFGRFVENLGGRYITAMDSGVSLDDMVSICKTTQYNASYAEGMNLTECDPAPYTAYGIFRGIQAAVEFQLDRPSLNDVHVAIQGVGHVGRLLTQHLIEAGARVTVTDVNVALINELKETYNTVNSVAPEEIYSVPCDVFAPCALGSTINADTIPQLQTTIIAGAANNQLKHRALADLLKDNDILWAPDYVINAGGVIFAEQLYRDQKFELVKPKVEHLYDTLLKIFEIAKKENRNTSEVAEHLAQERLDSH